VTRKGNPTGGHGIFFCPRSGRGLSENGCLPRNPGSGKGQRRSCPLRLVLQPRRGVCCDTDAQAQAAQPSAAYRAIISGVIDWHPNCLRSFS
jgi:hypothetical protein